MKIGDKILLYCKEHNMTMMDFSHLIGVDLRIVLNYTCKNTAPCSNIVNTMVEKMGVPVHYLIDDTKKGSYTYEN